MKHLFLFLAFSLPFRVFPRSEGTVRINEIMADPSGSAAFPATEYVELRNTTDTPVSLEGWVFFYGDKAVALAPMSLPAQGYVVLYEAGDEIRVDATGLAMPLDDFPSRLANAGKTLSLRNASGELIDAIAYAKAAPGIAWERRGEYLYLSEDERGGTPGSANSCPETEPSEPDDPSDPDKPEEPEAPSFLPGSVRVNEIMPDPKGQAFFPATEYVELRNATDRPIDLDGWSFVYGGKPTALAPLTVSGGGYVVLYRSGREIHLDDAGLGMPLDKFPASLANTGKELALLDPAGKEIDRVSYDKAKAGIAWERAEDGFYLSTDARGGTPGAANSSPEAGPSDPELPDGPDTPAGVLVLPGEIVFNELLPNPYPEGSEYIELHNRSDRALPLSGLSVATRRSDGALGTCYPLSTIASPVAPKGYVALTKSAEGVCAFYLVSSPDALRESRLPVLANTSATLVLLRTEDNTVIDEIRYASTWHDPSVKNEKGVSLERIDPEGDTQDETNWTSATASAGHGTPGYQNSQYGRWEEGETTGIEPPAYSEATKAYTISYRLDEPGYTCGAWVFDVSGKRIREVANHELLGAEGALTWDGLASNGSKVRAGVYIFYVELAHPRGKIKRHKEVFLVR